MKAPKGILLRKDLLYKGKEWDKGRIYKVFVQKRVKKPCKRGTWSWGQRDRL